MTPLRKSLVKILCNLSEDHVKTMDELEKYINGKIVEAYMIGHKISNRLNLNSESRAYSLYCAGKHSSDIIEILSDEYNELDADQIDKIVNDAYEKFKEKDVPLENNHE